MLVNTTNFGEVEINENNILFFEEGIPGFENLHKFGLVMGEDKESPFLWLQSIEDLSLAFALVNPFAVKRDYDFELNDESADMLQIGDPSQVSVYAVVVVPEDINRISMNLKAPIIVNKENNRAAQVILDTDKYSIRHFIMEEIQKQEV